ncbi:uroporphyrinogen-III synthase [Paracoccus halophilus]|uniref:Uroporphyrinogen-III synthase n=1 Tax=Paracoccus halophilus TaxID=376733 RepID=A0A099F829_9RHOB|nr:uroporphyrinogen-III synthase [Paracoccus halophilus]KGJ06378.1 uroporphyrinogen-III synthase [Paracoccus halophilus]SFA38760.1 uroporphyrinogen-III synthase [Paracoccus halophilus]
MPPNAPPSLLVTRPEPAARRFAASVAHLGLPVVISPVMRIETRPHDETRLRDARGLVLTSVHAVPLAGAGQGRPAICVGPATAEAARAAGFDVTEGPGDAARMMPLLRDLGPGWLHPHGAHVARVLPVPGMVVYDQLPLDLNAQARRLLAGRAPVILPLFSPRSARLVAERVSDAIAPLWLASISAAADRAWQAGAARRETAPRPDAGGVIEAVETLLAAEQSL